MSCQAADKLTGIQENENNLITAELQRLGYIKFISGEYKKNELGEWVNTPGSIIITPTGRAFLEEKHGAD